MADEILIFDATGSNVDGTDPGSPLSIGPGTSYPLVEASFPSPPQNVLYSSSIDTEGENPVTARHGNRTITLRLGVDESGAVNTLADALAGKFAKLAREGGTLKRTRKDGSVRIYDILAGDGWEVPYNEQYILAHSADIGFTLPAAPYARGAEQDLGLTTETTLPHLTFTETGIPGDVPALGRLVLTESQVADQRWLVWGLQSRNYSSSANAALFYEAESRTPLGGAATAVGTATPSGAGSNVVSQSALVSTYQAMLSTQASGGGAHLSHIGTFRMFARVMLAAANTGTCSVALEWAEGNFSRWTRNTPWTVEAPHASQWRIMDLGLVTLRKAASGPQRWEGRIVAKTTGAATDAAAVDCFWLVPADEGYGESEAVIRVDTPTSFAVRDEFNQTAGALAGKTLPIGGTWSTSGGAGDFQVSGTGYMSRVTTSASATNRVAGAGGTTWTNIVAQADTWVNVTDTYTSDFLSIRYVNASNYFYVSMSNAQVGSITVGKRIAAVNTTLYQGSFSRSLNQVTTLKLYANTVGQWQAWMNGNLIASGIDTVLATGGTLATGGVAIIQDCPGIVSGPGQVNWDNLAVWVPASDAAMFAAQTFEVRHDRAMVEETGGTDVMMRPSKYSGDYLRVPPAMAEARTVRVFAKGSRGVPGESFDTHIDDLSGRLYVTPRYL